MTRNSLNPISTDPNKNFAYRQSNYDKISGIEGQQADYKSKEFTNVLDRNLNLQWKESDARTKIHNLEQQYSQQKAAYDDSQDDSYIAETIKNIQMVDSDLMSTYDAFRDSRNLLKRNKFISDYNQFNTELENAYNTYVKNLGKDETKLDRDQWLLDPNQKSWYDKYKKYQNNAIKFGSSSTPTPTTTPAVSAKKGTKLRPIHEQLLIDSTKARDKALAQLSKQSHDLLKILLS